MEKTQPTPDNKSHLGRRTLEGGALLLGAFSGLGLFLIALGATLYLERQPIRQKVGDWIKGQPRQNAQATA